MRLLDERAAELRSRYGIEFRVTGIASRRLGWIADAGGVNTDEMSAKAQRPNTPGPLGQPGAAVPTWTDVRSWLEAARGKRFLF